MSRNIKKNMYHEWKIIEQTIGKNLKYLLFF